SARANWDGGAVYTFDLGMIAAGLISFGRATSAPQYLDCGLLVAGELAALIRQYGELPPVAPTGPSTERPPQWSTAGRVHLVKCIQALLLAEEMDAARSLCRPALAAQDTEGWWSTQPGDDTVMLHPLLYAVEGMWMAGTATGDPAPLQAAGRAVRWVWRHQLPSGGLPRWVSREGTGPEQADVTSQALRAAILLEHQPSGIEQAVQRLVALTHPDGNFGRALVYQPQADSTHLNVWVSMFGEQALRAAVQGPHALDWNTLV
ncbi:MAG TPA: hypothetical protein VE983_00065, partial [Solirubrobacteraceae bacterium]|nr:hypothetical protein [Solirubrobacteraceae bacterium]